jgi:hypothetical protein
MYQPVSFFHPLFLRKVSAMGLDLLIALLTLAAALIRVAGAGM